MRAKIRVKIEIKPFFNKKCKFSKKLLPKIGSNSNINVEVHVRTNFKMFPQKFC